MNISSLSVKQLKVRAWHVVLKGRGKQAWVSPSRISSSAASPLSAKTNEESLMTELHDESLWKVELRYAANLHSIFNFTSKTIQCNKANVRQYGVVEQIRLWEDGRKITWARELSEHHSILSNYLTLHWSQTSGIFQFVWVCFPWSVLGFLLFGHRLSC